MVRRDRPGGGGVDGLGEFGIVYPRTSRRGIRLLAGKREVEAQIDDVRPHGPAVTQGERGAGDAASAGRDTAHGLRHRLSEP